MNVLESKYINAWSEGMKEITNCEHKDRSHYAKGMCKLCYCKFLYKNSEKIRKTKAERQKEKYKSSEFFRDYMKKKNKKYRDKNKGRFQLIVAKSILKSKGIGLCDHCISKINNKLEELFNKNEKK
jgi:hypothetical protein